MVPEAFAVLRLPLFEELNNGYSSLSTPTVSGLPGSSYKSFRVSRMFVVFQAIHRFLTLFSPAYLLSVLAASKIRDDIALLYTQPRAAKYVGTCTPPSWIAGLCLINITPSAIINHRRPSYLTIPPIVNIPSHKRFCPIHTKPRLPLRAPVS